MKLKPCRGACVGVVWLLADRTECLGLPPPFCINSAIFFG